MQLIMNIEMNEYQILNYMTKKLENASAETCERKKKEGNTKAYSTRRE